MTARYLVFLAGIILSGVMLVAGLYRLQIVNGDYYAERAGTRSNKTIVLKGTRGMITDAEGVILAKSEKIYNVTFQRDNSQSSTSQYRAFTNAILDTISILKKYNSDISVTFPIVRDEEGLWAFDFGKGISEEATATRMSQWRSNHYLTASRYPTAEDCLERLKTRYQIPEGTDEETMLKVMAVYSEMQMNIFNSLPVVIAKDVAFSAVGEIEGRSVLLPGIAIEVGEKRVYPRSTLAS